MTSVAVIPYVLVSVLMFAWGTTDAESWTIPEKFMSGVVFALIWPFVIALLLVAAIFAGIKAVARSV